VYYINITLDGPSWLHVKLPTTELAQHVRVRLYYTLSADMIGVSEVNIDSGMCACVSKKNSGTALYLF
jgi:hypothetical protein